MSGIEKSEEQEKGTANKSSQKRSALSIVLMTEGNIMCTTARSMQPDISCLAIQLDISCLAMIMMMMSV